MKRFIPVFALLAVATFVIAEELTVGTKAPGFALTNAVDGKTVTFAPGDGKLSVVVFTCNQCPYAKAFEDRIVRLGRAYAKRGVTFYAIDSNDDAAYSVESSAEMKSRAIEKDYPFPYLKDGDSRIARAYGARVTPHIFVLDQSRSVAYVGSFDDKQNGPTKNYVADAVDALLAGKKVETTNSRAFGCGIQNK